MNAETTQQEQKLSKHLSAACNAIQKEIDRKIRAMSKLSDTIREATNSSDELREEIKGLQEQISKLKGE